MTRRLTHDQVRIARMRTQRLEGGRVKDVAHLVGDMAGMQAQHMPAARLSVRPRTIGVDADTVSRAYNEDRTLVRTWAMRGTLHMIAAPDVGWIVGLLGPIFAAADRRRRLQLGLDDEFCRAAIPALETIVGTHGPITRADLVHKLAAKGVTLDLRTQGPPHLIALAAMRGIICRGPDVDSDEPTYALIDDWAGKQRALDADESLAELTRRYVASRGPVTPQDFARWSGLPAKQARLGFELIDSELSQVDTAGAPAWVRSGTSLPTTTRGGKPVVRLVGHFDEYLLGYRSRDLVLDTRYAKRIQAGGGFIQPAVLVDGRVVGAWKQHRGKGKLIIDVQPFERFDEAALPGIEAEARDIGRFLATDVELRTA